MIRPVEAARNQAGRRNRCRTTNSALQAAAAVGVTVCVTSGDNGSTDGSSDGSDQVDFPSSSPYSLACGGTSLDISGSAIASEVVWNDLPNGGATGGGVSATFPLPSYQANAKVPPSAATGNQGRGVPDVSGDADPQTGYLVQADGSQFVVSGTSAVAPLWAGLVALLQRLGQSQRHGDSAGANHCRNGWIVSRAHPITTHGLGLRSWIQTPLYSPPTRRVSDAIAEF